MPTFIALYYNYTIKIPQNQHQIRFFVRNDFGKKQQQLKNVKISSNFRVLEYDSPIVKEPQGISPAVLLKIFT